MAALELRGRELVAREQRTQLHSVQRNRLIKNPKQLLQAVNALVLSVNQPYGPDPSELPLQPPLPETRDTSGGKDQQKQKPLVRVQLSVHYRVHSRQMLCVGGSQMPFGWSFLSIAKVPMTWNQGDIWTCEVRLLSGTWAGSSLRSRLSLAHVSSMQLLLPAGQKVEYKYVILEEQVRNGIRCWCRSSRSPPSQRWPRLCTHAPPDVDSGLDQDRESGC